MHVTHLPWCDFIVWSPIQDLFVERVYYDPVFMKAAVLKAQAFYFEKLLPLVVPYMIISQSSEKESTTLASEQCPSFIPSAPVTKTVSPAPVTKMFSLISVMEPVSLPAKNNSFSKTFTKGC